MIRLWNRKRSKTRSATAVALALLALGAAAWASRQGSGPEAAAAPASAARAVPAHPSAVAYFTVAPPAHATTDARLRALQAELDASSKKLEAASGRPEESRPLREQIARIKVEMAAIERERAQEKSRSARPRVYFQGRGGLQFSPYASLSPEVQRQREELMRSLEKLIDVEFRDASIRQAAQTLSDASGIRVEVDRSVTREKRLTVSAHGVSLRMVLEQVARQAGLLIAPAEKGVVLTSMPSLEVDGHQTRVMAGTFGPWSSEWGTAPLRGFALGDASTFLRTLPDKIRIGAAVPSGGWSVLAGTREASGPVSMAALGSDTLVVASPAPPGEGPGVTLTVYKLEGTQLRRVSSTLHRFGQATVSSSAENR